MRTALLLMATTLTATPAYANMTIAAQAAGGLIPARTEEIAIEEEDLYISPEKVRVRYVFRNLTDHAVSAPILFPLPDMDIRLQSDDHYVLPVRYGAHPPILTISVKVNGQSIPAGWQQRAYLADGREITETLKQFQLPMLAVGDLTESARKLSPADRERLIGEGIIEALEANTFGANWIVRGAYHWTQSFVAATQTEVTLEYEPLSGGYLTTPTFRATDRPAAVEAELSMRSEKPEFYPWHEEYCMTPAHVKALAAMPSGHGDPSAAVAWTRYILVSARNWSGPIRNFRLTVDKLHPGAVSAFCAPDRKSPIRKTGATTYQVEIRDFVPRTNFQMLTVAPY